MNHLRRTQSKQAKWHTIKTLSDAVRITIKTYVITDAVDGAAEEVKTLSGSGFGVGVVFLGLLLVMMMVVWV